MTSSMPAAKKPNEIAMKVKAPRSLRQPKATSQLRKPFPKDSEHTLEDLQDIEAREVRSQAQPRTLLLWDIIPATTAFQLRIPGSDPAGSEQHIRHLTADINGYLTGVPGQMLPLLVMPIGSEFYLVDGYHRLEAYKRSKWRKGIPVKVFPGTVEEASDEALSLNLNGKLALTDESRSEAAWTLVKRGGRTKAEQARLSRRSERLIGNMRRKLRDQPDLIDKTWMQVKMGDLHLDEPFDHEAWRDKKTEAIKLGLLKIPNVNFVEHFDLLADALESISPELPALLVSCWPLEAQELVEAAEQLGI